MMVSNAAAIELLTVFAETGLTLKVFLKVGLLNSLHRKSMLNDAPDGSARSYNGLRIAGVLAKRENAELKIFLMGDAVISAVSGKKVPNGYITTHKLC